MNRIIYLDPAHNGNKSGYTNNDAGHTADLSGHRIIHESDWTLDVAKRVQQKLKGLLSGYDVFKTRMEKQEDMYYDMSLRKIIETRLTVARDAHVLVSIHTEPYNKTDGPAIISYSSGVSSKAASERSERNKMLTYFLGSAFFYYQNQLPQNYQSIMANSIKEMCAGAVADQNTWEGILRPTENSDICKYASVIVNIGNIDNSIIPNAMANAEFTEIIVNIISVGIASYVQAYNKGFTIDYNFVASETPKGFNYFPLVGIPVTNKQDGKGTDGGGGDEEDRYFEKPEDRYFEKPEDTDGDYQSLSSGGISTSETTNFLLNPTEDERKYGPNFYDTQQPLIRFSTATAVRDAKGTDAAGDAISALQRYAEFLYYLLNAKVATLDVQCLSMPWIRPGFNVWYDPLHADAIYYCQGVRHSGSPEAGALTQLQLNMGRPRKGFVNGSIGFGALGNETDNVFIQQMKYHVSDFGEALNSSAAFDSVAEAFKSYYGTESFETTNAQDSEFHKKLYTDYSDISPKPNAINSDKIFAGTYTQDEIETQLSRLYASAPPVVQSRVSQLHNIVKAADVYIDKFYHLETHQSG